MKNSSENFMLPKDLIRSKNTNREIIIGFNTDEIIERIFGLILYKYQVSLK